MVSQNRMNSETVVSGAAGCSSVSTGDASFGEIDNDGIARARASSVSCAGRAADPFHATGYGDLQPNVSFFSQHGRRPQMPRWGSESLVSADGISNVAGAYGHHADGVPYKVVAVCKVTCS